MILNSNASAKRPDGIASVTLLAISVGVMVGGLLLALATDRWEMLAVLAAAPLVLVLCILQPFVWCVVFILLAYFRVHEAYPFLLPLRLPLAVGAMCLLSSAWHATSLESIKAKFWTTELVLMVILFVLVTAGVSVAHNRPIAFAAWSDVYWKIIVICLAIAWLANTVKDFKFVLKAFLFGGVAISVVAIYNKLNGIGLVETTRVTIGRDLMSPLGDPNDLALVLLTPLSFALAMTVYAKSRVAFFVAAAIAALLFAAILATQSRGGLLGLVAVLAVVSMRFIKSKSLIALIVGSATLITFVAMGIAERGSGGIEELSRSGIDDSSLGRLVAWQAAVYMALYNPLNGVGLANFVTNFYIYTPTWIGRSLATHSTWFQVLGEVGFPGFIVFIWMVVATLRKASRSIASIDAMGADPQMRALSLGLHAGLIGFCVSGSFLSMAFNWPIYILVALTSALARYIEYHRVVPPSATTPTPPHPVRWHVADWTKVTQVNPAHSSTSIGTHRD